MKINYIAFATAVAGVLMLPGSAGAHEGHAAGKGTQEHYGLAAALGSGTAGTYIVIAKQKDEASNRKPPVALGVEISGAAMNSLPQAPGMLILDFPIQARYTPFQYMMLDWNPQGHEPAGIYDLPHFDFHFYIQDLDEVEEIEPGSCSGLACDDYERAMKPVAPEFLPEGYINVGSVVPYMGNHLIDPTSPEFNGARFTRTWLYGSYDGRITFYEPMITRESLLNQADMCQDLRLPQQYAATGYYPTKYCTEHDTEKDVYRVYVKDFIYRVAPQQPR